MLTPPCYRPANVHLNIILLKFTINYVISRNTVCLRGHLRIYCWTSINYKLAKPYRFKLLVFLLYCLGNVLCFLSTGIYIPCVFLFILLQPHSSEVL